MKFLKLILTLALIAPAFGQERTGSGSAALDPSDIRNFLIQSQIVEYKPNLRRDPFIVLIEGAESDRDNMLVDQITVVGRVIDFSGRVFAVVLDHNNQARRFPVGYRFLDAEIKTISDTAVVFSQWDPHFGSHSVRRDITRVYNREEAR